MRFELKVRHTFHESFDTKEELFKYLRTNQVVFQLYGDIEPKPQPGVMTYLGDVKYVGVPYGDEKALYVYCFTLPELELLKRELEMIEAELASKRQKVPAES